GNVGPCTGVPDQRWYFSNGRFVSQFGSTCLDLASASVGNATPVVTRPCDLNAQTQGFLPPACGVRVSARLATVCLDGWHNLHGWHLGAFPCDPSLANQSFGFYADPGSLPSGAHHALLAHSSGGGLGQCVTAPYGLDPNCGPGRSSASE